MEVNSHFQEVIFTSMQARSNSYQCVKTKRTERLSGGHRALSSWFFYACEYTRRLTTVGSDPTERKLLPGAIVSRTYGIHKNLYI